MHSKGNSKKFKDKDRLKYYKRVKIVKKYPQERIKIKLNQDI